MKKYELDVTNDNLQNTLKEDILNRNSKLFNLIKLISNINENYIISIDGAWGCGKTFFVKQMMYAIDEFDTLDFLNNDQKEIIRNFVQNNMIIYYNAWENDDHINPLLSIIYNILNELPNKNDTICNDQILELTKKTLMNFIEKSSLGIIKADDLKQIKTFKNLTETIFTIEEQKEEFHKLLNAITKNKRIVLIVDELDRCKPDYAVKTLETIKHFYNIPNITILITTNNRQLACTIKHFYGNDFDGYGYLNKIYDSVITLKNENIIDYVKVYCNFMQHTHLPENFAVFLFECFNFSYREINKFMSMYRIVEPYTNYRIFDRNEFITESCIFLPLALALKIKDTQAYDKFIAGEAFDLLNKMFSETNIKKHNEQYYSWFCELFRVEENENLIDGVIRKYKNIFNNENSYYKFPYMDAISMLGNKIELN